ncbi:MAG: arsenate reductase (glutaredoxin) [Magnetococcales bacterium]|nr:arsenate reductase (glutaredoxin) [Magnetococcales bacterium]MBF0436188.1 arsenate reductase (glutaredoxin) [Magnetococcales bacterium]
MDHSQVTIWHNPQCSKSRQTLKILEDKGITPKVVRYLDSPPTIQELEQVLTLLQLEPRQLMRTKESLYKELGLDNTRLSRQELIQAMATHPKLIERPVVRLGNRAVLGRPPEKVLEVLS